MSFDVKRIKDIPAQPGVYLMLDTDSRIIYVGKAKNLKNRVSQYFRAQQDLKTQLLRESVALVDVIVTKDSHHALILEQLGFEQLGFEQLRLE